MIEVSEATKEFYELKCEECEERFMVPIRFRWKYLAGGVAGAKSKTRALAKFYKTHKPCSPYNETWSPKEGA